MLDHVDYMLCEYLKYLQELWILVLLSLSVSVFHTDTWRVVNAFIFRALQLSWYQSLDLRSLAVGHELLKTVSNDESG